MVVSGLIKTPEPRPRDLHGSFYRSEEFGNARNTGGTLVAATVAIAFPGNRTRKRATICNTGSTVIFAALGDVATDALGFPIYPQGVFAVQSDALGYIWVGPISLISAGTPTWSGVEET